jgi:prepilin-type N-terminal cleavage/methylation domain-containing protein
MKHQGWNTAGFTLMELMVAMAVLGILSGISIVNLSQQLAKERLLAASRETHAWLETQRGIAMTDATACEITINPSAATLSPSGSTIQLRNFNDKPELIDNACKNQAPLSIRDSVGNGSNIALTIEPSDATTIRFSMRGTSEIITTENNKSSQIELKLNQPGTARQRCIKIISPLALIRNGFANTSSESCSYSSSF